MKIINTPQNEQSPSTGDAFNTSGMGQGVVIPYGVKGWGWGVFLWNWVWAIGNKTWIGLLCLIPYVGFIFAIILGFKGREWAWQNKKWESVEHFNEVQKKWSFWGAIVFGGLFCLGILGGIMTHAF